MDMSRPTDASRFLGDHDDDKNTTASLPLRLKRRAFDLLPSYLRLPLRVAWMRVTATLEHEARSIASAPRGGTALDIGANHGVYSYFMVRHFDRVVAFEPQPACVQTLRSWANGRVEIRQVALSDHRGEGQLAIPVKAGVPLTGYARLDVNPWPVPAHSSRSASSALTIRASTTFAS